MAEVKQCPYCGEEILPIAKKCKHCSEWLSKNDSSRMKSKNFLKNFGKYLLEISIIVIGVTITLSASNWLSLRNEKRDMALYLNTIKLELEENIRILDYAIENYVKPDARYANYLKSHDIKSLNKDSIESYSGAYYSFGRYSFNTDAFEMFKSSGIMRLMGDKELLRSICRTYSHLMALNETWAMYFQEKTNDLKKESPLLPESERKEVKIAPMYNFYILGIPYLLLHDAERELNRAKEVVLKLESVKL